MYSSNNNSLSPLLFSPAALLLLLLGGNVFVRPLDDLVAKSRTNNLGRYYNFKKPDLQKFLCVTNQFRENHPKIFKLQI